MYARASQRFHVKSFILQALCVANVASALAQGQVSFNNHAVGEVISHVYLPSPASPGFVQIGNGTADFPAGTTDWTGWTPVSGAEFSAQLFAAAGGGGPVDSLAPAFPITTFHTGAGAGFVVGVFAMMSNVPPLTPTATVQMRVWDNQGGRVPDWATALAQPAGTELVGMSAPINVAGPFSQIPPALVGLQSFNLTYIPEPPSLGPAGLGGIVLSIAWLMRRANGNSNKCR
jgi:hypothetical protein